MQYSQFKLFFKSSRFFSAFILTLFQETFTIAVYTFSENHREVDRNMVTIKDVAKKCGYSVCTVSRALSGKGYLKEETKQKILETVAELGYRPNTLAVNLKTGRRQALALVLPSLTNIYYTKLEQYLESCASEKRLYHLPEQHGIQSGKRKTDIRKFNRNGHSGGHHYPCHQPA